MANTHETIAESKVVPDCGHNFRHGWHKTRLYRIWIGMRHRCSCRSEENRRYWSRGISVCGEWSNFVKFRDWSLANGYADGLSLDRIDNNGNYGPDNCRWTTPFIQSRNRCDNIFVEHKGIRLCITDWCAKLSVKRETVYNRYKNGYASFDELFFGPPKKHTPVECWTVDGEFVGTFHSGNEAAKQLGVAPGSVFRNCHGETKRVSRYTFKFKEA